jgi:hypothetical protein
MDIKKLIYKGEEREVLVTNETAQDIYGIEVRGLDEDTKKLLLNIFNSNFRHFKKENNTRFKVNI